MPSGQSEFATLKAVRLRNVSQTISEMKRIASQYRHDMDRFFGLCPTKFYYFAKSIPYLSDDEMARWYVENGYLEESEAGYEFVQRPAFTADGMGDCDDKSVMAAAYMYIQGIPWKFVTVAQQPNEWDHVYLKVKWKLQNGSFAWLPYDVTLQHVDLWQEEIPSEMQRMPWYKEW